MTQSSWVIDDTVTWPPRSRPIRPFNVTGIDTIRSCGLRACFESSSDYERRVPFAARIGTAFHKTLEDIARWPRDHLVNGAATRARGLFLAYVQTEMSKANARMREQFLPRDSARIDRAAEAIMGEASRLALSISGRPLRQRQTGSRRHVEIPVASTDGYIRGRVDRAEQTANGTRIVDYKSSVRGDVLQEHETQLLLYSAMWHQTFDEWPAEAVVVFPLLAKRHAVEIGPQRCDGALAAATRELKEFESNQSFQQLARPGEACKSCEFRPWCLPFWKSQSLAGRADLPAAALGFEGTVEGVNATDTHVSLVVTGPSGTVNLIAETSRFAHLRGITPGTKVRALDWRFYGLRSTPNAKSGGYAEVYIVRS